MTAIKKTSHSDHSQESLAVTLLVLEISAAETEALHSRLLQWADEGLGSPHTLHSHAVTAGFLAGLTPDFP